MDNVSVKHTHGMKMANFQTHLYGGLVVGIGGMITSIALNLTPITTAPIVAIAGIFGGIAPDLDHDHGRPIKIMFGLSAIVIPFFIIFRIPTLHETWITAFQAWCTLAFLIRYPICWLFKKCTVHRGIFHSIPAIGIFASLMYLSCAHEMHNRTAQATIGICAGTGYFIHLILDELWSVDFNGTAPRIKRSAGSALSLFKKNLSITALAYALFIGLCTLCWLDYNQMITL